MTKKDQRNSLPQIIRDLFGTIVLAIILSVALLNGAFTFWSIIRVRDMEMALDNFIAKFTVESDYYDLLETKEKRLKRFQTVRTVQRLVEMGGPFAHVYEDE